MSDLQIANFEFEQAKMDVIIAGSDLSPSATISYEIAEQDDFSATVKDRTRQTVTATASWPLFAILFAVIAGLIATKIPALQKILNMLIT